VRFDGAQLSVEVLGPRLRVIRMAGVLDPVTVTRLAAVTESQMARCTGHIVIDLDNVRYFGTDDLGVLVMVRDAASAAGIRVHLAGLAAREAMLPAGIIGALAQFSRFPTVEQAERELVGRRTTVVTGGAPRGRYARSGPPRTTDRSRGARPGGPLRSA
jgi:anti-anti-sigma regulatory factor